MGSALIMLTIFLAWVSLIVFITPLFIRRTITILRAEHIKEPNLTEPHDPT